MSGNVDTNNMFKPEILKQTYKKYKQLLPVLVLSCICIPTLADIFVNRVGVDGEIWHYKLTQEIYGAFIALIVCWISFFTYRPFYKYILLATLLLGFFNFISFTTEVTNAFVQAGSFKVVFQPLMTLIVLLTYLINYKRTNNYFLHFIRPDKEEAHRSEQLRQNEKIENFKEHYKNKTLEELEKIFADKRYVPEALEAANQLLNERRT